MFKFEQVKVTLSNEDITFLLMLLHIRQELTSQIKIGFFKSEERKVRNKKLSSFKELIKKLKQAYTKSGNSDTIVIYFLQEEQALLIDLLEEMLLGSTMNSQLQGQEFGREQRIKQARSIREKLERDTEGTFLMKNLKEKFNIGEKEAFIKNEMLSRKVINIIGFIIGLFLAWLCYYSFLQPFGLFSDLLYEVTDLSFSERTSIAQYTAWGSLVLVWFLRNRLGKLFFYVINLFFKVV